MQRKRTDTTTANVFGGSLYQPTLHQMFAMKPAEHVLVATARRESNREGILDAAAGVFLRYGFKKTSMDDLAQAASLSRQGLYLHFASKEELFKATLMRVLVAARDAGRAAITRDDPDVQECLLDAFEAMHGHVIGRPGAENMTDLLETSEQLIGRVVDEMEHAFHAEIAKLLRSSGVAATWKTMSISAKDLAEQLYATSVGLKHRVSTRAEYRERMRVAVTIVCRGL